MPKIKIIVLQHVEHEDLENIENFFPSNKFEFTKIKFFKNEKIPKKLENFAMMIVLGGPMDTWMEKKYPWLINEKKSIKEFVINLRKPFLGICLGCQLLGEVLGAEIRKSKNPEVGIYEVNSNKIVDEDKIFNFLPKKFEVLQWHSYEVKKKQDENFKILASSKNTSIQLFKYREHAYGMQFHLEIKSDTIERWCKINSNKKYLKKNFDNENMSKLIKIPKAKIQSIENLCKRFVGNFCRIISK